MGNVQVVELGCDDQWTIDIPWAAGSNSHPRFCGCP